MIQTAKIIQTQTQKTMAATGRLPITRDDIEKHYVQQLKTITAQLQGVAAAMKASGIEEIEVMNRPAADTALESFARLVASCTTNMAKARKEKSRPKSV